MRAEATSSSVRVRRKKRRALRFSWRWTAFATAAVLLVLLLIGLVYAGSSDRLAKGVHIAGVDVGGMSADEARSALESRARSLRHVPVAFTAAGRTFEITPNRLGVTVDWDAAVAAAQKRGDGFAPLRGFKRLAVRFFGADVLPHARVWSPALAYQLQLLARDINQPHRDAAVVRKGLKISVAHGQSGLVLDKKAAGRVMVAALASFSRAPVALPVRQDAPTVTPGDLAPAARDARRALRASVLLTLGPTRWRIRRTEIAKLLRLPAGGETKLAIGGPGAERYFGKLGKKVNRPPKNADWAISADDRVRLTPAKDGLELDPVKTENALLQALVSGRKRVAAVVVAQTEPARSTADARAMDITGKVSGYTTDYGGDPNRIHNVQLVAHLIDHALIAPGATFSFNQTTGDRNAAKGFLEAPVIINGELKSGLGGGVCQVSTTTFNAAFEAGLEITARTNHALYISHYPLGRDATVNYPDTDLKFVNDTPHWMLLRTFVGSSSLRVALYGTPVHRRVESEATPLKNTGPVPVKKISDPDLLKGQTVVEEYGVPPQSTSVHRLVYSASGKLLHDDTWYSSYRWEPKVVKVGTKVPPPPPKKEKKKQTTTTATTTGATTTTPGPQTP